MEPPDVLTESQYRELARVLHPNRNKGCEEDAKRAFQTVAEYYTSGKSGFRDVWPHVLRPQPEQQRRSAAGTPERDAWLRQEQFRKWAAAKGTRRQRHSDSADAQEVARIRKQFKAYDAARQPLMRRLMELTLQRGDGQRTLSEERELVGLRDQIRHMEFARLKGLVLETYLSSVTRIFDNLLAVQHIRTLDHAQRKMFAFPMSPADIQTVGAMANAVPGNLPHLEFHSALTTGNTPNLSKSLYALDRTDIDRVRYYKSLVPDLPNLIARFHADAGVWEIAL